MRMFITFLFMVLGTSAYATINAPISNQFDNKGALVRVDTVRLQVKAGEAIAAGDTLKMDLTADDGATVIKVTALTDVAICVAEKAIASGKQGRCLVMGKISANHSGFGNNAVAGAPVYPSPDALGGKVTGITSPAAANLAIGVFLDASSATESVEIFIKH